MLFIGIETGFLKKCVVFGVWVTVSRNHHRTLVELLAQGGSTLFFGVGFLGTDSLFFNLYNAFILELNCGAVVMDGEPQIAIRGALLPIYCTAVPAGISCWLIKVSFQGHSIFDVWFLIIHHISATTVFGASWSRLLKKLCKSLVPSRLWRLIAGTTQKPLLKWKISEASYISLTDKVDKRLKNIREAWVHILMFILLIYMCECSFNVLCPLVIVDRVYWEKLSPQK